MFVGRRTFAVALVAGATTLPRFAAAQSYTNCATVAGNLVQDCGFEASGNTSGTVPNGYTRTGINTFELSGDIRNGIAGIQAPHSDSTFFQFLDAPGQPATLAQTLPTRAGALYRISFFAYDFDYNQSADPGNLLAVTFGGTSVFSQALASSGYQQFTVTGVATGTSTTLAFTGNRGSVVGFYPSALYLDDLSVTLVSDGGPATTTPEPSTWALLGSGLAGLAGVARRRRAAAA